MHNGKQLPESFSFFQTLAASVSAFDHNMIFFIVMLHCYLLREINKAFSGKDSEVNKNWEQSLSEKGYIIFQN